MSELENCCGTTCDKSALAAEIAQLRQVAADRTKEAELAKRAANELQQRNTDLISQLEDLKSEINGIMQDSTGVAGYHLNGQIATWD